MMTKGGYMQDDDERLLRFANEWQNNKNPVTSAAYRDMYLRLYYEMYLVWQWRITLAIRGDAPRW